MKEEKKYYKVSSDYIKKLLEDERAKYQTQIDDLTSKLNEKDLEQELNKEYNNEPKREELGEDELTEILRG